MKRFTVCIAVIAALCIAVCAAPIYKYEETTPITDTVSLTNVREFYADYNISYSYIKMDLTDDRVALKLLKSKEGTDVLTYMDELAEDENTLAALNADFFSVYSGKKGFSLGIEKQDGEILQSPINPDTMATVAFNENEVLMTYLDFHLMAVAPNWEYEEIRHINKHTAYYGEILMYTSAFDSGYSPAPGGNVVEVVVEDNKIREFRRNMEPCLIPENGCVLVVSEGSSMFFANNFSVGDEIKFDLYVTPSLEDFDTAFGGGSMLVHEGKDVGKIGDYTHTVAGYNPRSAMGIDKEGKTLYLVAVDGRQEMSRGMRMSHLAELMIELGCYTAVNLDGGGSTRMLASTLWDTEIHPVNSPTENRRVINAIGIVIKNNDEQNTQKKPLLNEFKPLTEQDFDNDNGVTEDIAEDSIDNTDESSDDTEQDTENDNSSPEDDVCEQPQQEKEAEIKKAEKLLIKPEKDLAVSGERIKLSVAVLDDMMRSIQYDENELEFVSSDGIVEDMCLAFDGGGTVTVGVFLDGLYAETTVHYIDSVSGIVTNKTLKMKVGESVKLPVYVFDSIGRFTEACVLDGFEISSSDETVVKVNGNEITAHDEGRCIVTITKNGTSCKVSVAVGSYILPYTYGFEKEKGSFYAYPDDTKGGFELTEEHSLAGSFSGKLTFDFTEDLQIDKDGAADEETNDEPKEDVSRAVYFTLDEKIPLGNSEKAFEISVFSSREFNHTVKAQIVDENGKVVNLSLDGKVEKEKWSTLSLDMSKTDIKKPSLSRIYVLYTPGEEKDTGDIFLDELKADVNMEYKPLTLSEDAYRFSRNNSAVKGEVVIGGTVSAFGNPVAMGNALNVERNILRDNGIAITDSHEKSVSEDDYAVYVCLDTKNGGIRSTDSSQWEMLSQVAASSSRENLFVVTNDSIFGNDEFENSVVRDYLASLDKNVFVVSRGDAPSYMNIDGVSYFTVDSAAPDCVSFTQNLPRNAVRFFFGTDVTFEFVTM